MTVHVLIPVHNRAAITLECLALLAAQTYPSVRVVVVDDGSTDGTSEKIIEAYPGTEILAGDGNLWWTGAMSMGVEHILKTASPGDFILSLNDDSTFKDDYIATLVDVSSENGRAVTGSLCWRNGEEEYLVQGGTFDWTGWLGGIAANPVTDGRDMPDVIEGLDFLFGRGVLIPVEVFAVAGNYNHRDLPHYGGDTEFTHRAKAAGFRLIISTRALVTVDESENTTGTHFSGGGMVSLSRAWRDVVSMRSSYQLEKSLKMVELCCPPGYVFRSKLRCAAVILWMSFSRTRPLAAARALTYLLFRPFPVPAYELERRGIDIKGLVASGALKKVAMKGMDYYKVTAPDGKFPCARGEDLAGLYKLSLRITTKLKWLFQGLHKRG